MATKMKNLKDGDRRGSIFPVTMIVSAAVSSTILSIAGLASAATNDQLCEVGEVCLSDGTNRSGNKWTNPSTIFSLDGYTYNGTSVFVLNSASSIQNRGSTGWKVLVYAGTHNGQVSCYQSGAISNSLPDVAKGNLGNNDAGSTKWVGSGIC